MLLCANTKSKTHTRQNHRNQAYKQTCVLVHSSESRAAFNACRVRSEASGVTWNLLVDLRLYYEGISVLRRWARTREITVSFNDRDTNNGIRLDLREKILTPARLTGTRRPSGISGGTYRSIISCAASRRERVWNVSANPGHPSVKKKSSDGPGNTPSIPTM